MTRPGLMLLANLAFATCAIAGGSDPAPRPAFQFTPVPRWTEEPDAGVECAAIRKDCPDLAARPQIDVDIGYDELYDAAGQLVGLRLTQSTGCAPLDEDGLLSRRHFRLAFHHAGKPDLDDIRAEVAPGVSPDAVRIVKHSETSLSLQCN